MNGKKIGIDHSWQYQCHDIKLPTNNVNTDITSNIATLSTPVRNHDITNNVGELATPGIPDNCDEIQNNFNDFTDVQVQDDIQKTFDDFHNGDKALTPENHDKITINGKRNTKVIAYLVQNFEERVQRSVETNSQNIVTGVKDALIRDTNRSIRDRQKQTGMFIYY